MSDDGEGARENVGAFEFQINHHDPDHPKQKSALPAPRSRPFPPPPKHGCGGQDRRALSLTDKTMATNLYWVSAQCEALVGRTSAATESTSTSYARAEHIDELRDVARRIQASARAANTACVFAHRLAASDSAPAHAPRAMALAALYLASKLEEAPVRLSRLVAAADAAGLTKSKAIAPDEVLAAELAAIEALHDGGLVTWHPHRDALEAAIGAGLGSAAVRDWLRPILDDSYRTDVHLHLPPRVVGTACVAMTLAMTEAAAASAPDGIAGRIAALCASMGVAQSDVSKACAGMLQGYRRHPG